MERGIELATGVEPSVLFVPHLVPDRARRAHDVLRAARRRCRRPRRWSARLPPRTPAAPFVRVLPAGEMVDSKRMRGTNVVELQAVADARTGTAVVVGAVDNLVKGAAGQAIQNMNLVCGFDETLGLPSLAVVPMSVTFARGSAAGVTAGFKASGLPDLGLLLGEPGTTAAGLFTTNRVEAAPVALAGQHLASGSARAVLVNSGQANAATGERGSEDAVRGHRRRRPPCSGVRVTDVVPCSTGVIGEPIHMDALARRAARRRRGARRRRRRRVRARDHDHRHGGQAGDARGRRSPAWAGARRASA